MPEVASSSSTTWRDAEFLCRARAELSGNQLSRFMKLYTDEFYLLDIRRNQVDVTSSPSPSPSSSSTTMQQSVDFEILGATRTRYRVRYAPGAGTFLCTCPDARINCHARGCVCKHVCFVLVRVLKSIDIAFFRSGNNRVRSPEEFERIQRQIELLESSRDVDVSDLVEVLGSTLRDTHLNYVPPRRHLAKAEKASVEAFAPDLDKLSSLIEDCPICYDILDATVPADVARCPTCRNHVHTACMRKWLQQQRATSTPRSCVMCRSRDWVRFE